MQTLRKVKFKRHKGTTEYEGYFLTWANADDDGVSVTYGLIELPDGSVEYVYPTSIKFVTPTKK